MRKNLLHCSAIILAASSVWLSTPAHARQSEIEQLRALIQQQQAQIQSLAKKLEAVAASSEQTKNDVKQAAQNSAGDGKK